MQQHIIDFLSRGRTVLLSLAAYLFMAGVVMNAGANRINELAGTKQTPLDLYFSYTPEQVRVALAGFGDEARAFYALFEMTADVVYPIVYTFFLCSLLGYGWQTLVAAKPRLSWLIFLPCITFLVDILENTCIVIMLKSYPTLSDTIIVLGSLFTTLKWTSAGVVITVAIVGLLRKLYMRYTA